MDYTGSLQTLKEIDELADLSYKNLSGFIHKEHRFTIPLISFAQENNLLPKPCNLILFDAHHDACTPTNIDELNKFRTDGFKLENLIDYCKTELNQNDDDWILAGIELGLIKDVVVFGAYSNFHHPFMDNNCYTDKVGQTHRLEILTSLPGESLGYQGDLGDYAKSEKLSDLWDILEWELVPKTGFAFKGTDEKILVDLDLDCFTVSWQDFIFPWPSEVYGKKFLQTSNYWSTTGWTGKQFFLQLVDRAGLLTIAKEPSCCGGDEKVTHILTDVNRYLFDDQLLFS